FADSRQRRLRAPVASREAEIPVVDIRAGPVPVVGRGISKGASAAGCERRSSLPVERARLGLLAVPKAVQPDLTHDQRTIAGKVLNAREVGLQALRFLEVDIEANEVEEGELQILRGGIVDVGDQAVGILGSCGLAESLEVTLRTAAAEPAHAGRRDLVADRVAEDSRVAGAGTHSGTHQSLHVRGPFLVGK